MVGQDALYTGEVLTVGVCTLIKAAETNQVAIAVNMLDNNVDVDSATVTKKQGALYTACMFHSTDIVQVKEGNFPAEILLEDTDGLHRPP